MENKLGLGPLPTPFYIYVGEAPDGCLWYFLAPDTTDKVPVHEPALCGTLREVRTLTKTFKNKPVEKLELEIHADRRYVIRSGLDTMWSRGILLSLEQTADLSSPLYFCVRPSDKNEKIVFASLYTSQGERVKHEWDGERDLRPVVTALRARLGLDESEGQPTPAAARNGNGSGANTNQAGRAQPSSPDFKVVNHPPQSAAAHVTLEAARTGIHKLRQMIVDEKYETWTDLNRHLGADFGVVEVEELTREDAVKYGSALKERYLRHRKEGEHVSSN